MQHGFIASIDIDVDAFTFAFMREHDQGRVTNPGQSSSLKPSRRPLRSLKRNRRVFGTWETVPIFACSRIPLYSLYRSRWNEIRKAQWPMKEPGITLTLGTRVLPRADGEVQYSALDKNVGIEE